MVNTLILMQTLFCTCSLLSRVFSDLKTPMWSSTVERGGFWGGRGLLFIQANPYKSQLTDRVVSQTDSDC